MKKLTPLLALVGTIVVPCLLAAPAYAVGPTSEATYVDPISGDDGNVGFTPPCSPARPCQTIAIALAVTNSPGNVTVLRGGTFGQITITGSQSVTCKAVECIIDSIGGGPGVTISAGATDSVGLNGVTVSGFGFGSTGILVTQVGRLELKDVNVSGYSVGLSFSPGGSGTSHLFVMDSEIRNSTAQNVLLAPTSSVAVSADFTRTRIHHANAGILADASKGTGGVSVVMADSMISFANNNLVNANGNPSGAVARIVLNGVTMSHSSANGITSNGQTAQVVLYNSQVTQAITALAPFNGGQIQSFGDNAVHFNISDGTNPTENALK